MTKFPLLEALRAERERNEAEITAPVRRDRDEWMRRYQHKADALRALERLVGSELAKHVIEQIGHEMADHIRRAIFEAIAKARTQRHDELVSFTLPMDVLRFMDQRSMEREILGQYVHENLPNVSVMTDVATEDRVTILDIRVPPLGVRRALPQ